jgi:hypothetical protein
MKCIVLIFAIWVSLAASQGNNTVPEQIMVALAGAEGEMTVQWVTFAPAATIVLFGTSNLGSEEKGNYTIFVDPTPAHIVRYIHNVRLKVSARFDGYYLIDSVATLKQHTIKTRYSVVIKSPTQFPRNVLITHNIDN